MTNPTTGAIRPVDILIVENSLGDVRLLRKLVRDTPLVNPLHIVSDADSMFDFLCQRGEYADAPRPDIILLSWQLTNPNEQDVLRQLTTHPCFSRIPVIIITGTTMKKDQIKTTSRHASGFLVKPIAKDELIDTVCAIDEIGISIVHQSTTDQNE